MDRKDRETLWILVVLFMPLRIEYHFHVDVSCYCASSAVVAIAAVICHDRMSGVISEGGMSYNATKININDIVN